MTSEIFRSISDRWPRAGGRKQEQGTWEGDLLLQMRIPKELENPFNFHLYEGYTWGRKESWDSAGTLRGEQRQWEPLESKSRNCICGPKHYWSPLGAASSPQACSKNTTHWRKCLQFYQEKSWKRHLGKGRRWPAELNWTFHLVHSMTGMLL